MNRIVDQTAPARAAEMTAQMDLFEKASLLRYISPPIPRLSVPAYNWWNEALHGVARAGTATVFPQAIAMAAMFDPAFLEKIADVVSTEARAKYNENLRTGKPGIYKGLTMWSPNINIFRDPRWGRGQETYGEDPFLTSRLGAAYIKGLQGTGKYLKTAACAKHFAVHSGPEQGRHEFDAVVSKKDLFETYLPAFECAVREARVETVMGSYNRVNGVPACGNEYLLEQILRREWGFSGHVVSDCGAIADFHDHHKVTKTPEESAALALNSGCDLNCGDVYLSAVRAVEKGLLSEETITRSADRLLATRIRLGMFDDDCEYDSIPYSDNDSPAHRELAVETARRSAVLLKNDGILPLDKSKLSSLAVIGPTANSRAVLEGNYCGTSSQYVTVLDGIADACGKDVRLYYADGCPLWDDEANAAVEQRQYIAEAVSAAKQADAVVLCVGLDPFIEGEEGDAHNAFASGDKLSLSLPGMQNELIRAVTKVGKPTVLILTAGSAIDLREADKTCNAVLDMWYCGGRGGIAAADLLFGKVSPQGNLPVTFYRSDDDLPPFGDYSMKNRTYRYFSGKPLYPFGFGLSYSSAEISAIKIPETVCKGEPLNISLTVTNTGAYDFSPLVQVYIRDTASGNAPLNPSLAAFQRVFVAAGESGELSLTVDPHEFTTVDENGIRDWFGNRFELFVGLSQPDERSRELLGDQAIPQKFEVSVG